MASRAVQASVGLLGGSDLHSSSTSTSNSQSLLSFSSTFLLSRRATVLSSTRHRRSWTTGQPPNRFVCRSSYGGVPNGLSPELKEAVDKFVTSNKVVLFMKGNKLFPQCGFSNTVVQILNSLNVPYETVNILENEQMRYAMKIYSSWPTFPQLYVDGEFFGGCDITLEAFKNGELQEAIEKAMCS
uniref:Glutaredoxin-like protein 4 n=1 Tax=Pteris vittata TaxID=13821 RepID=B7S749_PTEVI|nr:glutaredoxin-like protein 4 [Pteris vittata]